MKTQETIYDIMPIEQIAYVPHTYTWYALIFVILILLFSILLYFLIKKFKSNNKKYLLKEIEKLKNISDSGFVEIKIATFLNNLKFLCEEAKFSEIKKIKENFDSARYSNQEIDKMFYIEKIEDLIKK